MQTLEIISVNIWQILISLANLVILFLLMKHFLYKPVKKVLAQRQKAIDDQYSEADKAKKAAEEERSVWEQKMQTAETQANEILQNATANASRRSDAIIAEAKDKADGIVRNAENEAELQRLKAEDDIKNDIVDLSAALTEKLLSREINSDDHKAFIDSFIEDIGGENE